MKYNTLLAILVSILLVTTFIARANAEPKIDSFDKGLIENVVERLNLSEAQREAVRSIIIDGFKERAHILKAAGFKKGQRPSFRQLRKVKGPIKRSRAATEARLSKVLKPKQMEEYLAIMEEVRQKNRARIK